MRASHKLLPETAKSNASLHEVMILAPHARAARPSPLRPIAAARAPRGPALCIRFQLTYLLHTFSPSSEKANTRLCVHSARSAALILL
jgi:hypothetical protein